MDTGSLYYINNIYPDVQVIEGDYYVITTLGDRLDIMSNDFYGDPSYWVFIASANNLPGDSLFPPIGAQIRIPANIKDVYTQYRQFNTNR